MAIVAGVVIGQLLLIREWPKAGMRVALLLFVGGYYLGPLLRRLLELRLHSGFLRPSCLLRSLPKATLRGSRPRLVQGAAIPAMAGILFAFRNFEC